MPHHLPELNTEAKLAILTGDPERISVLIAGLGQESVSWTRRGFVCSEVLTGGGAVLLCSTGIGGASTAIVAEELNQLGIDTIARVGTCGSMRPQVVPGDVVISIGCVRDEGTSHQYLPPQFPAVPDFGLTSSVTQAAAALGVPHHVGITHCKDAYYAEKPNGFPLAGRWRERWQELRGAGVLATEMEAAALFAVATVRSMRAAALFVAVDGTLTRERLHAAVISAAQATVRGGLDFLAEQVRPTHDA